jgi:phosphatidylglycerol:prolipoprotein diacylglycerol transferase
VYPNLHLGPLTLSTYFFVISVASTIACLWFLRRAQRMDLPRLTSIDITLVTLICGFIGARLLHVFYEEPEFYREQPWRVLQIWYGGFVFLGGVVGAGLGAYIFCLWKREAFFLWADLAAPPIALGYALGRIACFFNGCCYGKHCELPWAVFMAGDTRHPTQLYATAWEFLVIGILLLRERQRRSPGSLFALWLALHAVGRMMMEHFRDDPRGPVVGGFSLGTWMSIGLLICGLGVLWTRPRGTQAGL